MEEILGHGKGYVAFPYALKVIEGCVIRFFPAIIAERKSGGAKMRFRVSTHEIFLDHGRSGSRDSGNG